MGLLYPPSLSQKRHRHLSNVVYIISCAILCVIFGDSKFKFSVCDKRYRLMNMFLKLSNLFLEIIEFRSAKTVTAFHKHIPHHKYKSQKSRIDLSFDTIPDLFRTSVSVVKYSKGGWDSPKIP